MSATNAFEKKELNKIYRFHEFVNQDIIQLLQEYVDDFNEAIPTQDVEATMYSILIPQKNAISNVRFVVSLSYLSAPNLSTDLFALEIDRNNPEKKYFIQFSDENAPQAPVAVEDKKHFKELADIFIDSPAFDARLKKDYDRYLQSLATA